MFVIMDVLSGRAFRKRGNCIMQLTLSFIFLIVRIVSDKQEFVYTAHFNLIGDISIT